MPENNSYYFQPPLTLIQVVKFTFMPVLPQWTNKDGKQTILSHNTKSWLQSPQLYEDCIHSQALFIRTTLSHQIMSV